MSVAANKEGTRERKKNNGKGSMMTKQAAGGCGGTRTTIVFSGVNEGLRVYRHKSPRRTERGDDRCQRDTFDRPLFLFFFSFTPRGETVIHCVNWETGISTLPSEYSLATFVFSASPSLSLLLLLTF